MTTWQRRGAVMLLASALSAGALAASDASIQQVYQAAAHGQLAEAQQMMAQVLKDHPNSGKAHYVEAELLARQGQMAHARAEFGQAERLAPGLPFAQPAAVSELRAKLAGSGTSSSGHNSLLAPAGAYAVNGPAPARVPWGWLIAAVALAGLGFAWWRSRQPSVVIAQRPFGGMGGNLATPTGYGPTGPYPGYGTGMGGGVFGGSGGGMGSQMLGGLATGAAVGAGMIAGEALMHRVLGDDDHRSTALNNPVYEPPLAADPSYDMGGNDFGLNDTGSWDDGGGGVGGDDWN